MVLIGDPEIVPFINYSFNGDILFVGCDESEKLGIWDVASGQCRAVIQDLYGHIRGVNQNITSEDIHVITISGDGGAVMWKISSEEQYRPSVQWVSACGGLTVKRASIQDVRGLSQPNKKLLKQRGATGEPALQLSEVAAKITAMASVISKLEQPTRTATLTNSSDARVLDDQVEA
jgi:WD40 repeat protein